MHVDAMQHALGALGAQVLDAGWAAVVVTDPEGTVLAWNRQAEELYGWAADEVLGRSVTDVTVCPEDAGMAGEIMAQILAGEPWEGSFRVRRRDGSAFVAHVRDVPVVDERGAVVAVIGCSVEAGSAPLAGTALAESSVGLDVRHDRLARLQALTAALSGAVTVEDVAAVILGEAAAELDAGSAALWLLDDDGQHLTMVREVGLLPSTRGQFVSVPLDDDIPVPLAVKTAEPVVAHSREERDRRWPALTGIETRMEAVAVLPLLVEGQAVGVLAFGFPAPRRFDDEEMAFFSAISDQCAIAVDRARLHQAERALRGRLEFVADATAILTERVDRWDIVRRLAELCVPTLADWCSVFVPSVAGLERVALVGQGVDDRIRELLTKHPLPIDLDHPVARAYRTGQVQTVADIGDEMLVWTAKGGDTRGVADRAGVRSGLVLPLTTRDGIFGVVTLKFSHSGRVYDDAVRTLAEEIASRAATAVQQALVFEREHGVVTSLRRALFPAHLPIVPGIDLCARYMPASDVVGIGGDWWDAFVRPGGTVSLAIGDVGGHGEAAAAAMSELRNALRAYALDGHRPAEVVTRLSRFARHSDTTDFATVVYVDLEPATGRLRWSSAGHPPPLLLSGASGRYLHEPKQPALGLIDVDYTDEELVLSPEQSLLLYSDGLVEGRTRDIDAGLRALLEAVTCPPCADLVGLADGVAGFAPAAPEDDISFLGVARVVETA